MGIFDRFRKSNENSNPHTHGAVEVDSNDARYKPSGRGHRAEHHAHTGHYREQEIERQTERAGFFERKFEGADEPSRYSHMNPLKSGGYNVPQEQDHLSPKEAARLAAEPKQKMHIGPAEEEKSLFQKVGEALKGHGISGTRQAHGENPHHGTGHHTQSASQMLRR